MRKFQIRLVDKEGCGSFLYVEAETNEQAENLAVEEINSDLKQKRFRENIGFHTFFHQPYKPFRTVKVVEIYKDPKTEREYIDRNGETKTRYDWKTKRGGHKFALVLQYIEFGFSDGSKERNVWYSVK